MSQPVNERLINPILLAGCLILMISFAIRASFGLFQIPIAEQFGWLRSEFSLAIAIQNLAWGVGQPIFGAIAEKFGDKRAIIIGAIVYALGLVLSSYATTPGAHQFLEILIGFGIAGTGFGVVLAVVGRSTSAKNRSLALGIATAAGSAGQVVGPPFADFLLRSMAWSSVFLVFAGIILAVLLALPFLGANQTTNRQELELSMGKVLTEATKDPSFAMIFLGFFSCGFQLAFITAHFPAYIAEMCSAIPPNSLIRSLGITNTSALGAASIALIGLANIIGTIAAGALGRYFPKKYLLALIYTGRTIAARRVYTLSHDPDIRRLVFLGHGWVMACDGSFDLGVNCTYLWLALYGYAIWYCIFFPINSVGSWGCGWVESCTTSLDHMTWFGG